MIMASLLKTFSFLSTNPLFSSIITLYTLLLLYFPTYFLGIVFSPVLISTFILLLSLLKLGASQEEEAKKESESSSGSEHVSTQTPSEQIHEVINEDDKRVAAQANEVDSDPGPGPNPFYEDSFLEWDVRAPLEVIYEAYEGEEEGNGDVLEENRETQMAVMERYASLSMYYPETDTDTSSSEGDFPVDSLRNLGFQWDEEDGEGLIEIALDGKRKGEAEEENLIEFDFLRRVSRRDDVISQQCINEFPHEVRYS